MSVQNTKDQIMQSIENLNNLDFAKLYVESVSVVSWEQMDSKEIKSFVDDITGVLKNLKTDKRVLDGVITRYLNELKSNLEQFINNLNALANLSPQQITNQHHSSLNNLNSLNNTLRTTNLYTQLKLTPGFDEITKRLKEANKELKLFKAEEFSKAISVVDDLIKKKISFEDKTIKEHLGTFINSANGHRVHRPTKFLSCKFSGQWWWLFSAGIMGVLVAYIVFSFIAVLENNPNISAGAAILRISSLIIPSYFTFFFISQFNYHKKMYEAYSFKNTALGTMTDLMKTNQNKADFILEKGLIVLFSEPQAKDEGKYDKQLVNELIGMLKSQIDK